MTKRHLIRLLDEANAKNDALLNRIHRMQERLDEAVRLRRINEQAYDELRKQMNDLIARIMTNSAAPERK